MDIKIGNGLTSIDFGVFEDCTSLTSITIPNSVTRISASAFKNCKSLMHIRIPNSVYDVEEGAFEEWTKIRSSLISKIRRYSFGKGETGDQKTQRILREFGERLAEREANKLT
jgi:hypothetical protein